MTHAVHNVRIQSYRRVVLRRVMRRCALIFFGTLLGVGVLTEHAQAQAPACQPMGIADMRAGLDQIEAAMRRTAQEKAMGAIILMFERMACLTERATPNDLARYGRLRCEIAFWDQDEDLAIQWCSFAQNIENQPWPSRIGETHPIRQLMADIEKPEALGPSNKDLASPKGGVALLDGRPSNRAVALVEVPHFVQLIDKKQIVVTSRWIDGAAFPEELLIAASGSPPSPPKWLPGSKPRPDWDAPQTTLTEAEEKEIIEDRSNDPSTEEDEGEDYNPDVPLIHETYTYVAPPESSFGRLSVRVLNHKEKQVKAPIMVDGTPMGNTPWEGELAAGAHFIEVMEQARDIVIQNGMLTEATIVLRAPQKGGDSVAKAPKEKVEKEPKEKQAKEPKEPKEKQAKEPKEKQAKEPKEPKEPKASGSKNLGVPLIAIGGGTAALGIGGIIGSYASAKALPWNAKESSVSGLKAINGVSWGLAGVGLGITAFGVLELSKGKTVSVAAGPRSITIFGRW